MKRFILSLVLGVLVGGCATTAKQEPHGNWIWTHRTYGSGSDQNHKYVVAKNTCKIESLTIPIPSPSCVSAPAYGCEDVDYSKNGFQQGFCRGQPPRLICDDSSVKSAKKAQTDVFNSCMAVEGWSARWVVENQSKAKAAEANSVKGLSFIECIERGGRRTNGTCYF